MRCRHLVTALHALMMLTVSSGTQANSPLVDPAEASSTFRATRLELPEALINYVATHAQPRQLDRATYPAAHHVSAQSIIEMICGKSQAEYEAVWRKQNHLANTFDMSRPIGEKVYGLSWPACFYISEGAGEFTVKPDLPLGKTFLEQTGRAGTEAEMREYFQLSNVNDVKPGRKVPLSFATQPVTFTPTVDKAVFDLKVAALAVKPNGVTKTAALMVGAKPQVFDEIVTAVNDSGETPPDCLGNFSAPFDAARIRHVLSMLRRDYKSTRKEVTVMVLDNGFSAAHMEHGQLSFASKFPKQLFKLSSKPGQEEALESPVFISDSVSLEPLISLDTVQEPRYIAGHGTHVVGTIMGGQWMDPALSLFAVDDEQSWLHLRIIPLSAGRKQISRMAVNEAMLRVGLSRPEIVNMSVRYGLGLDLKLTRVITDNPDILFIVAAGNDARDVIGRRGNERTLMPASLGGNSNENVISVAAENGSGYLTPFSNYSATRVDIAALGCNVASWLDGEQVDLLSGTSQATGMVSFAATLLARYGLDAISIKRRLLTSGDILEGMLSLNQGKLQALGMSDKQSLQIYSRSRINIEKSLLFHKDYVRILAKDSDKVGSPRRMVELLGNLQVQGAIECSAPTDGQHVFALKRSASGGLWCFPHDELKPYLASPGADFQMVLEIQDELTSATGEAPVYVKGQTVAVALDDLQEFIRSDTYMHEIQGEQ
ncbi:S8 family serine peptidase [Pseudomonas gingeri]|uniref:S8 family serine peptidase n=1 Tax=Pseudomonas gingeri TaxID=117681 RepID=UPI0015A22169|nr:S8 family serine peptidase [Pseudomonas gingeri]NWA11563.1 S8 family serine peptidase [Pseudomonas gingeri]